MKFGASLSAAKVLLPIHSEHFFPYNDIKKAMRESLPPRSAFTNTLQKEVDRLTDYVEAHVLFLERAAAAMQATEDGLAPYAELSRISAAAGTAIAFIHANRSGLRKIAKKYDKKRASVLSPLGGIDASPTRQAVVLRWLEKAPLCTTSLARLTELQQALHLVCPVEKHHLLSHVQQTSASCLDDLHANGTPSSSPSEVGFSASPPAPSEQLPPLLPPSLVPGPALPPLAAAAPSSAASAAEVPVLGVQNRLARLMLSLDSKPTRAARQRRFSWEQHEMDSPRKVVEGQRRYSWEQHESPLEQRSIQRYSLERSPQRYERSPQRHPHEPTIPSQLSRDEGEAAEEGEATGYGYAGCLPPTLQPAQPAVVASINGLFS